MCQVSGVTCQVSLFSSSFFSFLLFLTKWWSLSGEGLLSTGPTPSSFESIKKLHRMCIEEKLSDNYNETIESFNAAFEVVHQLFG